MPLSRNIFIGVVAGLILGFLPSISSAAIVKPGNNLGLVGYWPMNEGTSTIAGDSSGNGNNGVMRNFAAPATALSGWGAGKFGKGLNFDMVNDFISASSTAITGYPFTMSAWVYATSSNSGVIMSLTDSANAGTYTYIAVVGGVAVIQVRSNGGATADYTGTIPVSDSKWHLVTVVFTSATSKSIYVDGVFDVTGTANSGAFNTGINTLAVGTWRVASSQTFFGGKIDEVRTYSRVLSATEVAVLYKVGSAKTAATQSSNNLNSGLVGYWTMDGADVTWSTNKVIDRSGSVNGQMTNMSTTTSPTVGKIGQAMLFQGTDQGIKIGSSPSLTGDFSVSVWVKRKNTTNDTYVLSASNGFGDGTPFLIRLNQFSTYFYSATTLTGAAQNDTNWHHLVTTRNSSTGLMVLYIDGVSAASTVSTTGTLSNGSNGSLFIGSGSLTDKVTPTATFQGLIDDVRIYNRDISATEVKQLYNIGAPTKPTASQNRKLTSGLVGLWSLDGKDVNWGTGKALDRSGNGNDGQITSMSTTTSPAIGKIGQALTFDKNDDIVNLGSATSVDDIETQGGGGMTASAWVRANSYGEINEGTIVTKGGAAATSNGRWRLGFQSNNGTYTFEKGYNTTSLSRTTANGTGKINQWQHVVVTWDGSATATNIHIYIDGVETSYSGSSNGAGSKNSDASELLQISNGSRCFDGVIDDVRIYNRVLSAAEITQLYNMGR